MKQSMVPEVHQTILSNSRSADNLEVNTEPSSQFPLMEDYSPGLICFENQALA